MAVDATRPRLAKTLAFMVLAMQDKYIIVLYGKN